MWTAGWVAMMWSVSDDSSLEIFRELIHLTDNLALLVFAAAVASAACTGATVAGTGQLHGLVCWGCAAACLLHCHEPIYGCHRCNAVSICVACMLQANQLPVRHSWIWHTALKTGTVLICVAAVAVQVQAIHSPFWAHPLDLTCIMAVCFWQIHSKASYAGKGCGCPGRAFGW
jgi:hypothetical protein